MKSVFTYLFAILFCLFVPSCTEEEIINSDLIEDIAIEGTWEISLDEGTITFNLENETFCMSTKRGVIGIGEINKADDGIFYTYTDKMNEFHHGVMKFEKISDEVIKVSNLPLYETEIMTLVRLKKNDW